MQNAVSSHVCLQIAGQHGVLVTKVPEHISFVLLMSPGYSL